MSIYKKLAKEAVIQLKNKELTFEHKLAVLSKLRQVASGFVYHYTAALKDKRESEYIIPDGSNAKLKELELVLEELNPKEHKIIIIHAFQQEYLMIDKVLSKFGIIKKAYVEKGLKIDGQIERFKKLDDCPILIGQIQKMSHGLDLSFADVMIHFGHYWSSDLRRQVVDRIHRIGQTKKCIYIDLAAKNTIEISMLKLHERNIRITELLVQSSLKEAIFNEGQIENLVYGGM